MTFFLVMLAATLMLDATVRPRGRRPRRWQGLLLHLFFTTQLFGVFLAGSGSFPIAAAFVVASVALFTITSNAKHAMLGEPLLFSDLALIAGLFRHPRFYFTAISVRLRVALVIAAPFLLMLLAWLFVPRAAPHVLGLGMAMLGAAALWLLLRSGACAVLAQTPDVEADVARYGLIATILLYWLRWRATPNPPICPPLAMEEMRTGALPGADAPDIIVVVQCESFADPVELTGQRDTALAGLSRARSSAWQWGDLAVSGFGAYTMRTEYGVLFGRGEAALGFRRYDPFLTAHGETSYALSARLSRVGYGCLFVHPHDMRFYGRDRLMPAIGFDRMIGEESFPTVPREQGRYVDDRTLGAHVGELIDAATQPTLIYAVTMENHGPWIQDQLAGSPGGLQAYVRHVRSSDKMLDGLIDRLANARRSALLVFFGDHRPSMPGITEPGGPRHTPYVMLRFSADGRISAGANQRTDLTPAELHHAILSIVTGAGPGSEVGSAASSERRV